MREKQPVVGVIDSNNDMIELMKIWIRGSGFFRTFGENLIRIKDEPDRYLKLLARYNPRVLVVDIPIPYEENWRFVSELRSLKESEGRGFVLTTTNKPRLEQLVGATNTLELIGKPLDLDELAQKVLQSYQSLTGDNQKFG